MSPQPDWTLPNPDAVLDPGEPPLPDTESLLSELGASYPVVAYPAPAGRGRRRADRGDDLRRARLSVARSRRDSARIGGQGASASIAAGSWSGGQIGVSTGVVMPPATNSREALLLLVGRRRR